MPEARCGATVARIPVEYSADEMANKVLAAHSYGLEVATANQLRLTALGLGNSSRRTRQGVLAWWTPQGGAGLALVLAGMATRTGFYLLHRVRRRSIVTATMPNFARGQSVADAWKGSRIPRERREAPNPLYLPGVGEGPRYLATPFHPSGDRSPGAPDGGGCGGGPPVHRRARHQQDAWRPAGARVLPLRRTSRPVRGRSERKDVSRRRAERRLRSLGRFAQQLATRTSCSPNQPAPSRGGGLCRPSPLTTARIDVRQRLSEVQERPRRPGNLHRGEGVRVHRGVPTARPPAHLHQYARGRLYPLSLLRDAVPLRSSIDTTRCRPAGQRLY